jgi:hypothetical protein
VLADDSAQVFQVAAAEAADDHRALAQCFASDAISMTQPSEIEWRS